MSDHLPECRRWFTNMPAPDECPACEMFRACEQRVWKVAYNQGLGAGSDMHGQHEKGWVAGYDAAVQAVREAVVAAYAKDSISVRSQTEWGVEIALAAIDALKEKP